MNSKPGIRVVPAGPQLQARDRSGPPGPEQQTQDQIRPPPDLNHRESPKIYQIIRMPERLSEDMPDTYARRNVGENVRAYARMNA